MHLFHNSSASVVWVGTTTILVELRFAGLVPIAELLSPFSFAQSFVDATVERCWRKGIAEANCAVVIFDCDGSESGEQKCRLSFLGSFSYSQDDEVSLM